MWSIDIVIIEFLKSQSVFQAYIWADCLIKCSQGNVNESIKLSLIKLGRLCCMLNFYTEDTGRFWTDNTVLNGGFHFSI